LLKTTGIVIIIIIIIIIILLRLFDRLTD